MVLHLCYYSTTAIRNLLVDMGWLYVDFNMAYAVCQHFNQNELVIDIPNPMKANDMLCVLRVSLWYYIAKGYYYRHIVIFIFIYHRDINVLLR